MKNNSFLMFVSHIVTDDVETKISTVAQYDYEPNKQVISFKERNEFYEDSITTITVDNNDTVTVTRSGEGSMFLMAHKNKRTISQHNAPYGSFNLGVTLTKLKSSLDENGGDLSFSYKTDTNFKLLTEIDFNLRIKKKKSD